MGLPILSVLPAIKKILGTGPELVLIAPPGAGKTTVVPVALLAEPWLAGRKILMLQPRRLAARMAAQYMASRLGEQVGETVGYRVRLDSKVGPDTRIEIITEGVFIRIIQNDPLLSGIGAVIFDEYHERSLSADLALALCLQARSLLREDLRVVVMSATLDAEAVAGLLGGAPVVRAEGRSFPVETVYLPRSADEAAGQSAAAAVMDALAADDGDLLVFLPGAAEIRRVKTLLAEKYTDSADVRILPLHGNLPPRLQEEAIKPSAGGGRKVVLATSIAETSLTVEGITTVIDSGLARVPRFSPRTAMMRLETVRVSRASADQRRGRAGRTRPGRCYRLWTEQEDKYLSPYNTPEILEADLTALVLELALWGVREPAELAWLDCPPELAFLQACDLLQQLGAIDGGGKVTAHGRLMGGAGIHPRLAHMIIKGKEIGCGVLACQIAALLSERDVVRSETSAPDADFRLRVELLRAGGRVNTCGAAYYIDPAAYRRTAEEAVYLAKLFAVVPQSAGDIEACGLLLAFAYPDRIAQRRENGRFLQQNGRGAELLKKQELSYAPYVVIADLDDRGSDSRINMAAPLSEKDLFAYLHHLLEEARTIVWDSSTGAVKARKEAKLGAITIKAGPWPEPDPALVQAAFLGGIRQEGLAVLPWTKQARQLRDRIQFMHKLDAAWPDVADTELAASLEEWLGPFVQGMTRREDLRQINMTAVLESLLTWSQRRELEQCAPTHITVPSGNKIAVDYAGLAGPVLAVRLQEMFGCHSTPQIACGKVALTLHLLSPAGRPVQITRDLAGFWRTTYHEVRKDLAGRYPKHYWPDDPFKATATGRVRPRNT